MFRKGCLTTNSFYNLGDSWQALKGVNDVWFTSMMDFTPLCLLAWRVVYVADGLGLPFYVSC